MPGKGSKKNKLSKWIAIDHLDISWKQRTKSDHQLWSINCWLEDDLEEITLKNCSLLGEWVQSSCGIKKVFHTQWKQDNVNKNAREWLRPRNKNRTFTAFMVENHITTSHTNIIIEILYPCSTKLILINYTCERKTWHKVVPFINIYLQGFIWQG